MRYQDRHLDPRHQKYNEYFKLLLKSGYWQSLPEEVQEDIMVLIAEYCGLYKREER